MDKRRLFLAGLLGTTAFAFPALGQYNPNAPANWINASNPIYGGLIVDGNQSSHCSTSTNVLTCSGKNFTVGDVGKVGWISYGGPGFVAFPFTISGFINSTQVSLSGTPTTALPFNHPNQWGLASVYGSGYVLGNTAKPNCSMAPTCTAVSGGDAILQANAVIPTVLPVIAASGSGGSPGASCTLYGTTGRAANGNFIQIGTVTLNGSGNLGTIGSALGGTPTYLNTSGSPSSLAVYLLYPDGTGMMINPANEPVSAICNSGNLIGAALNFTGDFGAYNWKQISDFTGFYSSSFLCDGMTAYQLTNVLGSGSGSQVPCTKQLNVAVSWGTDNTQTMKNVVAAANAASGNGPPRPNPIYVPSGLIVSQPLNSPLKGMACMFGDGPWDTVFLMEPNVEGDMFSLLDNTQTGRQLSSGTFVYANDVAPASAGNCGISNIGVIADRSSSQLQAAERFYGGNAWMHQDYFFAWYVRGPCISIGYGDSPVGGSLHESWLRANRCEYSGDPGGLDGDTTPLPSIQLVNVGQSEQMNNLRLSDFRIFDSFGPGIQIASCGGTSNNNTSDIGLDQTHVELSGMDGAPGGGDDLMLGEPNCLATHFRNYNGGYTLGSAIWGTSGVQGFGNNFTHPRAGYAAIHLTAANPANAIGNNNVLEAQFTGGGGALGMGVNIGSGQNNLFIIGQSNMFDYSLKVVTENYFTGLIESPGLIGPNNAYDDTGNGDTATMSRLIEPAEQPTGTNPIQWAMYTSKQGGHPLGVAWEQTQTISNSVSGVATSMVGTGVGSFGVGRNYLQLGTKFVVESSGQIHTPASGTQVLEFKVFGTGPQAFVDFSGVSVPNGISSLGWSLKVSCVVVALPIPQNATLQCNSWLSIPTSSIGQNLLFQSTTINNFDTTNGNSTSFSFTTNWTSWTALDSISASALSLGVPS